MRSWRWKLPPVLGLILTTLAAAQALPGAGAAVRDAEIGGLLRQLENAATRQAAGERLTGVTAKQLVPLYEALDGKTASEGLKKELVDLLPRISAKVAAERRAEEAQREAAMPATYAADYVRFGKRDAKWDDLVAQAYKSMGADGDAVGIASAAKFKAALDAGCTDPVVRYYYVTRALFGNALTLDEAVPQLDKTALEVDATRYPAIRKFYVNIRFADLAGDQTLAKKVSPERIKEAVDHAVEQFATMVQEAQTSRTLIEAVNAILAAAPKTDPGRRDGIMRRMTASLVNGAASSATGCALAAECRKTWAWEARGSGFAGTVTETGWKVFDDRITLAEEAARKGWGLDPSNAGNPLQMIWVCIAKSSDRTEMEKWYRRAMFANPDSYDACWGKMNYLFPKWQGSRAEVLAFGRECVKSGTPANRIPAILLEAHKDLCSYGTVPNAPTVQDLERYYQQPEAWADVQSAYNKLLSDKSMLQSNRAQYLHDRGTYFKLAFNTKHYETMVKLADEFGDELDTSVLGSDYLPLVNGARRRLGLLPLATAQRATPAAPLPPVSFHGRDASLASVAAALDGQIGGQGLLVAATQRTAAPAAFSFDGDQVPLWDVVAKLEAAKSFGIAPSDAKPGALAFDESGLRVLASKATDNALVLVHPMVKDPTYGDRPILRLTFAVDPRTPVVRWEVTVREVYDEQQHMLLFLGTERKSQGENSFLYRHTMDRTDAGKKLSFAVSLTYTTRVSAFSATINDPQDHVNQPMPVGRRSVTLKRFTTSNTSVVLAYAAVFKDAPATAATRPGAPVPTPDSITGRLYDGTGKLLRTFPIDPVEEARPRMISVPAQGTKGPYRLDLEYPDQVREETANFSFGDIPIIVEEAPATRRILTVTPTSRGPSIPTEVTTAPAATARSNVSRPATSGSPSRPARAPASPAATNFRDLP